MQKNLRWFIFFAVCGACALPEAAEVRRVEQGNLVLENIPDVPGPLVERLSQYQNVRSASIYDWLPDGGGMLIGTRFGETAQVHTVRMPLGMRKQITFYGEPVQSARWCPHPSLHGFIFSQDTGGSEYYQIYFFDMTTGKARLLTDGESRNEDAIWAPNSTLLAYSTTARNGRDYDIVVLDVRSPESPVAVLQREGSWGPEDWSSDGRKLILGRYVSAEESYYYVWNLDDGTIKPMRPETGEKIAYGAVKWAAGGKGIYYTSDEGSEFKELRYLPSGAEGSRSLTRHIPWDVETLEMSPKGDRLAFTVNEGGYSRLYLLDTRSGKMRPLAGIPRGVASDLRFHPGGGQLAFTVSSASSPGDIFSVDTASGKITRWTESEVGGLDTASFVEPEIVHYPTFDSMGNEPRRIPALYYRPAGEGPFPVVINIHGGPEAQSRPYFSAVTQYYLKEMGVAVLMPNVRGSRGYGKTYLGLDNGYLREDSVKDIGALLDWIETRPELDVSRVAVMGGSYGGYMTLACMTHYDARLRGGIDSVGISNFVTFLENTSDYRRDLRRVEYGDERDPGMREFQLKISPTTNAHKITRPMFIAQGLNDPRVPAGEAEQIAAAVRGNGGEVWYFLAKDEGHGFSKKSNRDLFQQAAVLFLEKIFGKEIP
jgi:dipeptidyl aminopeptidase/acylaminoacyl peptidase